MSDRHRTDHTNFPYQESHAAVMLATGLKHARERGVSLRSIGRGLGYKQPVAISHMASGRIPIPIERAAELADQLGLEKGKFLLAVLDQRYPNIPWASWIDASAATPVKHGHFVGALQTIAGRSLNDLSEEQMSVMREVVADANPGRRWLTVHEIPVIELLRRLIPKFRAKGMPKTDQQMLEALFE